MGRIVFTLRTVLLEMMSGHVQGSVLKLFVLFLSMPDISLQMLDIYLFIVIGHGQVKGSISDRGERELLTVAGSNLA